MVNHIFAEQIYMTSELCVQYQKYLRTSLIIFFTVKILIYSATFT